MSAMQPTSTHPLVEKLLSELNARNIDLENDAVDAIQAEFYGRLNRSKDSDAVLAGWDKNMARYVDYLGKIAAQDRKQRSLSETDAVVLSEAQVRPSFVVCGKLCPGPS